MAWQKEITKGTAEALWALRNTANDQRDKIVKALMQCDIAKACMATETLYINMVTFAISFVQPEEQGKYVKQLMTELEKNILKGLMLYNVEGGNGERLNHHDA